MHHIFRALIQVLKEPEDASEETGESRAGVQVHERYRKNFDSQYW